MSLHFYSISVNHYFNFCRTIGLSSADNINSDSILMMVICSDNVTYIAYKLQYNTVEIG